MQACNYGGPLGVKQVQPSTPPTALLPFDHAASNFTHFWDCNSSSLWHFIASTSMLAKQTLLQLHPLRD